MEPWPPGGHHLNIVTPRRVSQLSATTGLSDVFPSQESSIVAGAESRGSNRLLAIADGRVVLLHDLSKCSIQRRYKLGRLQGAVQVMAFGYFQQLFFTTDRFNFLFDYCIEKDRVSSLVELPAPATHLAVSKKYILAICHKIQDVMLVALQPKSVYRFRPSTSGSQAILTSFHPEQHHVFLVVCEDGTLSIHNADEVISAQVRAIRGRLGSIRNFHAGDKALDDRSVVAAAFIAGFPARIVTVGQDCKGRVTDVQGANQILYTWDLSATPTCLSVLSFVAPGVEPLKEGREIFVAVGRADGRISLINGNTYAQQEMLVDLQGERVISVEWSHGPASYSEAKEFEQECQPGLSEKETAKPDQGVFVSPHHRRPPVPRNQRNEEPGYEDTDSTPRASRLSPEEPALHTPVSGRSIVASFSSALSRKEPSPQDDSNETIIVTRLSSTIPDLGFADIDATRTYSKPKRPMSTRRPRKIVPIVPVVQPDSLAAEWQTQPEHSPAKPPQLVTTRLGSTSSAKNGRNDSSPARWSKQSNAAANDPTKLLPRSPRPPTCTTDDGSTRLPRSSGRLRRSIPINQAMPSILRSKMVSSVIPPPVCGEVENETTPVAAPRSSLGGNVAAEALLSEVGPSNTSSPHAVPSSKTSTPQIASFLRPEATVSNTRLQPDIHHQPDPEVIADAAPPHQGHVGSSSPPHHSCPCNCAVMGSLHRLEDQIERLREELTLNILYDNTKQERHTVPPPDRATRHSEDLSKPRSGASEGWVKVGRFMVRRAEGTTSTASSWRRRLSRKKVRMRRDGREGSGKSKAGIPEQ